MPEGDTIAWAAHRIRPVLQGRVPDEILTPQPRHELDRWPQRLAGRVLESVETHGKHLFLCFEGELLIHSHLGMTGAWFVARERRPWRRAWIILRVGDRWVVERDGPLLELITEGRRRFDQRLAALGPDVLAPEFDAARFLTRLRGDDPTRGLGDALLDQRNLAGIGNIWKAEGCWEAQLDPWRPLSRVSDEELVALIEAIRPRMLSSANEGPRRIQPRIYRRAGQPCLRCGVRISADRQGDANRTTYWCPGCQR
ncbi:MAG TPA: DNA-formamidopyrimidine glycosylase family protein [Solirubrobacteraceae bacterium]|nr:DNA-formamidopyrimidine glycosylase family protein [Solirubrobacteraceae bacterium]